MKLRSDGRILCPVCRKPTQTKVNRDTVLHNFPLWCPWCKLEKTINLGQKEFKK